MITEYRIIKKGFAKVIEEEINIVSEVDKNSASVKKMIWVKKYVMLIEYEERRISHLIIYDSELDARSRQPKNIIVIDKHISVQLTEAIDEEKFCLMIYKDLKDSIILAYYSFEEIIDWKSALSAETPSLIPPLEEEHQIKTKIIYEDADIPLRVESPHLIPLRGVKQEVAEEPEMTDNMIYEDSNSFNNMYAVEIQDTEIANRLNLHGCYTLKLYDDGLQLLDKVTEHVLYSWSVTVLRRYGTAHNKFLIECGRGSQTGAGKFIFLTAYHEQIKQAVDNIRASRKAKLPTRTDLQKNKDLRERGEQTETMGYSVLDRGECRYPRNLHNSKVVKERLREVQKQNEDMGYTRNLDNSKNLKIENEIYGGAHTYTVKIVENETAKRFELRGDYELQLRDDTILLLNMGTNNILFSWPVGFLRRYDCSNNTFSFETGRRSETGVERFVVSTIHCEIITQKVFEMCEHVKENKAKSDSYESESTDSHERTDREEPRDDTTAKGPKIIWKNYPPHYFDTREHSPEPDQQKPRGIQYQQDSPESSLELRELEISNYPEWTPQCPGVHVQGFKSPTNTTCNDILISSKSENLD